MEYKPMLATASPFKEGNYAYEVKWDGVRCIAYVTPESVQLLNRSGNDITQRFPELQALRNLGIATVLDGEIVALNAEGKPDFSLVQQRTAKVPNLNINIMFEVFDVLEINTLPAITLPYSDRRGLLEKMDWNSVQGPARVTLSTPNGPALFESTRVLGLEGIVAKPLDSKYHPGRRDSWLKMKHLNRQEFVICGFTEGEGRRAGTIGALILGYHDNDGNLVYAGKCGTGFDDKTLDQVSALLAGAGTGTRPRGWTFREPATYVAPTLVCEVEFAEWTKDNILRFPSFKGMRDDKDPRLVVKE